MDLKIIVYTSSMTMINSYYRKEYINYLTGQKTVT